jgi:hypothetical protein
MRVFYFLLFAPIYCFPAFAQQNKVLCGTSDEHLPKELLDKMARLPAIIENQRARTAAGEMRICRIGVEIDSDTYALFEGDTNLITRRILEDISKVSKVYEKEVFTRMVVGNIRIWKDPNTDPFRLSDNTGGLLTVLDQLPAATAGLDKRIYLYTKRMSGGASGLATTPGTINVSAFGSPSMMMHEFGHNFGSAHTHNCNWPGGPIDACTDTEGECYDKALESLDDKTGTIMSYCSGTLTFHPLCQAVMRDHAEETLLAIPGAPEQPRLTGNSNFTDGDLLIWNASASALSYEISYATRTDFSDSKTLTTVFQGIQFKGMEAGSSYYVKVRAVNKLGNSSWSEPVIVKMRSFTLYAPTIVQPAANQTIGEIGVPYAMNYTAVAGATGYEVQMTSNVDPYFLSPYVFIKSGSLRAEYRPEYPVMSIWRVRAVDGQMKGKWSDTGFFSVNPKISNLLFLPFSQDLDNAPVRFPFAYNNMTYRSRTRISVYKNSDFTNPVFSSEYTPVVGVLGVVSGLPTNTQLYFRLEEWNEEETYYPKRKIADLSFPFKTGTNVLPGNLVFMSEADPKAFNETNPKIAVAEKSIWTTSRSYGYLRINQESLTHRAYSAKNTDGLIGFIQLYAPLQTDETQNIHILSKQGLGKARKVQPVNDVPDKSAAITRFYNDLYVLGFNPTHNLYWTRNVLYRQKDQVLEPLKTLTGDEYIKQVLVASGKIWVLVKKNPVDEVLVLDLASGKQLNSIGHNTSRYDLIQNIDEIAVDGEEKIMLKQFDYVQGDYRISFWNNQKWTTFGYAIGTFPARIRAVTTSPSGEFYALTSDTHTGVYKYKGSNWENIADIPVGNLADNLYPDLNDNIWLTGTYGIARLSLADFDLTSVDKTDYCVKDSITAVITANGKINTKKPLTAIFTISTGGSTNVEGLMAVNSQVRIKIPESLAGTDVSLQLKTTEPEMLTKSKRQISIHDLPTATIVVDKTSMIPEKDTAVAGVTLTGRNPWSFKLWDNERVSSESASYTRRFVLSQPTDFELKISELADKFCTIGTVKNSIMITANVVTGTESALSGVSIYPNPSTDKIIVRYEKYVGQAQEYFISDARGSIVGLLNINQSVTEWDIRHLSAGTYILWTVQQGSKRSWKFVKN